MRVLVIGTGTGIGKTHLGVLLLLALRQRGLHAVGLKPIESGVGEGVSDGDLLAGAGVFHVKHPQPYAFADPVSPHLAARRAGRTIDLGTVRAWVDEHQAPFTLVESAGALLSPLGPDLTNLDLCLALAPDALVLVGLDRLGVLHEVSAALLALRVLGPSLPAPVVVLQAPVEADRSTGTNADELGLLGIASRVLTIPRGAPDAPEVLSAAQRVIEALAPAR
ncbi:MAG: ATP-dependent dethiobiotin synthetase BioD [Byssovorax sp.]